MNIIRKPVASSNFHKGRNGHKPLAIVIHIMDGHLGGTDSWFNDPHSHVSSNYGIGKSGEIHGYVDEADSAAAQGVVNQPAAKIVKDNPGINPNLLCISIEHEGFDGDSLTAAQKQSSAELIADIAKRNGIPLDADHVIPHHSIRFGKTCPGPGVNVAELIALAKQI